MLCFTKKARLRRIRSMSMLIIARKILLRLHAQALLEHSSVAVNQDRWFLGVWPVNLGNLTTTLCDISLDRFIFTKNR